MTALTATGESPASQRFDLDDEDEVHSIVQQRLDAVKPLELRIESRDNAKCIADATLDLVRKATAPAACVVFANTPKTARETFARLCKVLPEEAAEMLLLTGLTREREAERVRARILDPAHGMAASREAKVGRQRHLIVVATQTLEVGADIDAELLVTEACGVRALTQRLGRLNRLGRFSHARAAYVHLPPPKTRRARGVAGTDSETWPVYEKEPASVLERLRDACGQEGTVNLSPRRVADVLGPPGDFQGRAPEILPGILWEWTKTTTPPEGEAPVEPYFSGVTGAQYTVSLIWRVHVPEAGERLWPRATDREAVDVSMGEVRAVLGEDDLRRLASDGVTVEVASGGDLRPGDHIVLPANRGLLDAFGWNPAASGAVMDVSLVDQGLPLDATAIERLCGLALGGTINTTLGIAAADADIEPQEREEAAEVVRSAIQAAATPAGWDQAEWTAFTKVLSPQLVEARKEVPRLRVKVPGREPYSGDFDETSLGAAAVELDQHGEAVGARARVIANRIGLPHHLTAVVEQAGRLHDIGKADRRFQRWLDPEGKRGVLVAKSNTPRHLWEAMRATAGWPRGGRHEDLSARLVRAWLEQDPSWGDQLERDLLLHLVISHPRQRPATRAAGLGRHARISIGGGVRRARHGTGRPRSRRLGTASSLQATQRSLRTVGTGTARSNRDPRGPRCVCGCRCRAGDSVMTQVACPGLPAPWINGWLAAVGATVLDGRLRLHWTSDGAPVAVLSAAGVDPVEALVESWPDRALLSDLPIAETWKGAGQMRRKVPVDAFVARARAARSHRYSWTLSSTMTDLCVDENGEVAHAPFDPAGPGTIKWLHHRLMKIHRQVEPTAARIRDSLSGQARPGEGQRLGI